MPDRAAARLGPPEHDPIADEQDLLTVAEAAARLHDELAEARARLTAAQADRAPAGRIEALRGRIEVLELGLDRYQQRRRDRLQAERTRPC